MAKEMIAMLLAGGQGSRLHKSDKSFLFEHSRKVF